MQFFFLMVLLNLVFKNSLHSCVFSHKDKNCETIHSAVPSRKHLFPYLIAHSAVSLTEVDNGVLGSKRDTVCSPVGLLPLERTGSYSSSYPVFIQHPCLEVNEGWKCIHTSPPTVSCWGRRANLTPSEWVGFAAPEGLSGVDHSHERSLLRGEA